MCAKASPKRARYNLRPESKKSYLVYKDYRRQKVKRRSLRRIRRGRPVGKKSNEQLETTGETTVIVPNALQVVVLQDNCGFGHPLSGSSGDNF